MPIPYLAPPVLEAWRADSLVTLRWGGVVSEALTGYKVLRRRLSDEAFETVATLGPEPELDAETAASIPPEARGQINTMFQWEDEGVPAEALVYVVALQYRDGTEVRTPERSVGPARL